jgi:hypothetical protein
MTGRARAEEVARVLTPFLTRRALGAEHEELIQALVSVLERTGPAGALDRAAEAAGRYLDAVVGEP